MEREIYLVRAILTKIKQGASSPVEIPGYNANAIKWHLELLQNAELITAVGPNKVMGLTWKGHDLANVLGNDLVWERLNDKLSRADIASLPIDILIGILNDITDRWARDKIGL